jgi:hypothetical protein
MIGPLIFLLASQTSSPESPRNRVGRATRGSPETLAHSLAFNTSGKAGRNWELEAHHPPIIAEGTDEPTARASSSRRFTAIPPTDRLSLEQLTTDNFVLYIRLTTNSHKHLRHGCVLL